MNLRRLPGHRPLGVDHGRQHVVDDDDGVGGVPCGIAIGGDDHGNRLAHIADGLDRHRVMVGRGRRCADRHRADELRDLRAGEHRLDAWHALGGGGVDGSDVAVRDIAALERDMQHADHLQVVDVGALPPDEPWVFSSLDTFADQLRKNWECGHELRLVRRVLYGVDDVLVAGAATEVAVQPVPDLLLGR